MSEGSKYKLLNIILLKSDFEREDEINFANPDFSSNIDINFDNQESEDKLFVNLIISFWAGVADNKQIKAFIKMLGIFEYNKDSNAISLEEFAKINAPAIIFPFVREHLASLSTKAGINPILLPPINFVKLAEINK